MFSRLFRRGPDLSGVEVTFISKEDCHLCDQAFAVVEALHRRHGFRLTVLKIEEGTDLFDRYHEKIPVGLIDGRMAFKYRVDPDDFLAKLRSH